MSIRSKYISLSAFNQLNKGLVVHMRLTSVDSEKLYTYLFEYRQYNMIDSDREFIAADDIVSTKEGIWYEIVVDHQQEDRPIVQERVVFVYVNDKQYPAHEFDMDFKNLSETDKFTLSLMGVQGLD